jgi:hypothetical protein
MSIWPSPWSAKETGRSAFHLHGKPLSAKMRGSVLPSNLLSSCSRGTTHDYAIGRAGPSLLSSVAPHARAKEGAVARHK